MTLGLSKLYSYTPSGGNAILLTGGTSLNLEERVAAPNLLTLPDGTIFDADGSNDSPTSPAPIRQRRLLTGAASTDIEDDLDALQAAIGTKGTLRARRADGTYVDCTARFVRMKADIGELRDVRALRIELEFTPITDWS